MVKKRALPLILALCLLALLPSGASALESGLPREREELLAAARWERCGVIDASERFDTEAELTRGAAAALLSELLGLTEEGDLSSYWDVDGQAWYALPVARCVSAGILDGVGQGQMRPEEPVSREMFYVMLFRALRLEGMPEAAPADVADWTRDAAGALRSRGWLEESAGIPWESMTCGEAFLLLDRAVSAYSNKAGETLAGNGGFVLAAAPDLTVTGTASELLAAPGTAGGVLTLRDLRVAGVVTIWGDTAVDREGIVGADNVRYLSAGAKPETPPEELPEETPPPAETPSETAPPVREELEELPSRSAAELAEEAALRIGPAPIVNYDDPETPPYESYTVTAAPGESGQGCDVLITVTMEALRPHAGNGAGTGYWSGFSIQAPEEATGYRVAYSATGGGFGDMAEYPLTGDGFTRFFDTARWTEYYIRLAWTNADGVLDRTLTYKVDFSGVELDTAGLTEPDSPLGQIGPAAMHDMDGLGDLCGDYGLELNHRRDENGGFFELSIRAEDLRAYHTVGGRGHWAGFAIAAPAEAESYRCSVYLTLDAARRNFAAKRPVSRGDFSRNIDGAGAVGVRQLTDAAAEDQRDYWAVVQWFADAAGEEPLTAPEVYHILVEATFAD